MKLREYLYDRKYLLFFYIVLMVFVSAVISLSPMKKISTQDVIYINFVSLVFLIIYLAWDFIRLKIYYNQIDYIIENIEDDTINSLPDAKSCQQRLCNELLKKIYEEQQRKIEKLYKEKKEYLEYIIAWVHEVKTPISVSKLTIESSSEKSKEEILRSLEEELDKIEGQVEQALYYSRVDAFANDYLINEVNLDDAIKTVIKKHAKTFINKRIAVEIEDINIEVLSDKKWLHFILDQIVANSLKYTNEGGRIIISKYIDNKGKKLIIEDNGIGIKSEDIRRVFEKGFTGYTGRENYKSTGMGLYLARQLARKLGHDLSIESTYGEFTRTIIHFPKLKDYYNVTKL